MQGRNRVVSTLAAVATVAVSVLLSAGAATAAPKPGKYSGDTSEKGAVTFMVSADGKSVVDFSAQDGYNDACHFHGGVGGIRNFTVTIPRMTVSKSGHFTGTVSQPDTPFSGTTTLVVQGELTGSTASGTATAKGEKCGSGSATPNASLYLESFTASAA
jgi:hypothetical protein